MRMSLPAALAALALAGCNPLSGPSAEVQGFIAAAQMVPGCYEEHTRIVDFRAPEADFDTQAMIDASWRDQPDSYDRVCFGPGDQARAFVQMVEAERTGDCGETAFTFEGNRFSGNFECLDAAGNPVEVIFSGSVSPTRLDLDLTAKGEMGYMGRVERKSRTTLRCVEDCGSS